MAALEEALGCGGWCDSDVPKFYKFTDINGCGTLGNQLTNFRLPDVNAILLPGFQGLYVHKRRDIGCGLPVCLFDLFVEHFGGLLHLLSSYKVRKEEKLLHENDR